MTLTAYGNPPCNPIISTKTLLIRRPMTAVAGTAITACSSVGAINVTAGSSATFQTTVTWTSSGTGTFANPNSLTTCTYTPSAADITAGSVTLTLTASNGGCADVTSTKTLTIRSLPTAIAGAAFATCSTSGAINITAGSSAPNQTSVTWTSNGTGTFTNANSLTLCTYNPSAADITAGSRIFTLTAFGSAPCANATATKVLTISRAMTANAGTAITTCSSVGAVNITAGSTATNQTAVTWTSSGTGTFANSNSLTTCTYTPSAADIVSGSVTLTLTASNAGCANVTSTKTLTIRSLPTAVAGAAFTTCSSTGAINITTGSSATNQASVTWTSSGTGTFTNANSLTLCTYNPSAADITAGTVTFTLTAVGNAPCANATATKVLTISRAMTVNAGTAITNCSSVGTFNVTAGSSATNHTTVTWTSSGTGTFANPNSLTTCTYTPSAADITAGSVTLTLTASNIGCPNVTSTKIVTIRAAATAVAGSNFTSCYTSGAINITTGASASNFSSVTWTSNGTGTFTNANSLTLCTYTPSAADIVAGSRTFTLTATGNAPCANATSTKTMTIFTAPTVTGTTPGSRTGAGSVFLAATASVGTLNWYANATGGAILGSGTGFSTPSIAVTTTYYVEAANGTCVSSPRIAVIATVNYNEIDIQGNATSIASGDITPSIADWTDFGSSNATRTYTIRNVGVSLLTIGTLTISGVNASEFTVTTPPSPTIPIGGSTTFTITFAPTAVGVRSANIAIINNDLDESPYTFDIQGTSIAQEIDVQGNAVSIANGDITPTTADWTDFSSVVGTRTYTIRNNGSLVMNIGAITITGVDASDFTVSTPPAATIAAFGSTTFIVTFAPTAINTRSATINIANDDTDENPYTFNIQGFGIIPEIDVQGNSNSIVDNDITPSTTDWTDFSSTASTRTFTIFNNGNITLNVGPIVISGANAADFSVITTPSSTVAAFSTTTFVVLFSPSALGLRTATITFSNNDSTENPYNFNIQGTGVPREIDVQGLGLSIPNGDMVTSVSDDTDFGPADINLATITKTFTIRNSGSLSLTISNPTITGLNASEFSISANPGTLIIGAGSSTTFSVTFNPSAVFTRVATINIVSDDSDENPYTFAIQGAGLLDNDSDGIPNNADLDDDNDGVVDSIECGTCISDPFVNGSFENPVIPATSYRILASPLVNGWTNSAEAFIEIWSTGFNGVPAAAGNQFAELNANVAGNLYQTFCLNGAGGTINWSIKHRGRSGTDVAAVRFGATLATIATVATMTDGNTSWGSYSGTYAIPVGQTSIVLAFTAISSTGGLSYGNFIDDVQIIINQNCIDSDADTIADIIDVDDDNDGIPSIEEVGFKAYSNGTATMDKTNVATWTDADANGINDFIDTMLAGGTYVIPDADGDGVRNYLDLDSDNDTLFDVDEANTLNGDGDINGDGKGDGADAEGDGLLNLYDNSALFGSTTRPYAQDSDLNGIADFLQLDSNDDGTNDIQTGLYGSFDINGDGKVDGTGDTDGDGILNNFDTNDVVKGSPRDLDRKLYLDFDGRNDYGQDATALGILPNETIMAWIDLNSTFSSTGVVAGQPGFQLKVNSARNLQAVVNGSTITFSTTPLATSQWTHVGATYNGSTVRLFLNGQMVASGAATGSVPSSALTIGKNPSAATEYFKGKIDEVRVFNVALTDLQLQRMVYQEVQNTASQVRGTIVPKDIEALPYANMLRNYRMDAYKDDIVDNFTTATIDVGSGMRIYNHKVIRAQEAPMPFVTRTTGTFATAVNDPSKDIRGMDVTDFDYSIIRVNHNITETANSTDLAMFVNSGVTITMNNDTKIQNDWYLDLDGKIDLQGKSQLVQTANSELDVTSAGSIERDQQGQSNMFNYNYWCSPVGALSTTANNTAYTVSGVMRDGTDPNNIQPITWTTGYNGAATSPITLSSYWIFKFQNLSPEYANWAAVGNNGTLQAAQGYTMKGTAAATESQNYTFVGKPNNGTITTPIAGGNLNLCGNPYPSALDADAFITANSSVMTGAVYFWEHFNTNNSHNLLDYQGGYAARNLVGGTPPVAPTGISGLGSSSRIPSRFIPVGQGFLVYAGATGGNITFNNNQRSFIKETNASSNVMFRHNNQSVSVVDRNFDNSEDEIVDNNNFAKIRLGFNSVNGYHRQILLGFMDNLATEGFDPGYDATQLDSQPNDLYFTNSGFNLVIQGVDAFDSSKILPLSVKNGLEGNVEFVLDATENFDENQNIYIHDNVTDQYHDIRNGNFEINLPIGTFDTRFSLRFTSTSLDTNDFDLSEEVLVKFTNSNDTITINNGTLDATVQTVDLYNMLGQSIRTWEVKNADQKKIQIPVTNVSTGTYIVKVHTTKGDLSSKIIIE
ncbi:MAG: choice-of-anchor D domain-containing protein [Flavobacterium sp.]|nr:choice-of-anchor D domain-containing protein [Flavobacterium sp.]